MDFDFTTETITPDATGILTIAGTGGVEISVGTTGERPITPIDGTIRYNTTDSKFEFYQASTWINIGTGSSPLTTKGDLYTHNATVDTRLPVGTSGYFLKANPASATGLEWVQNPAVTMSQVDEEPTGFPNRTDSKISFVNGSRIFTIQPNSPATQFSVYQRGVEFIKTVAETVTLPTTSGLYYISYDVSGVLNYSTTHYDLSSQAPVSLIYWNNTAGYATLFGEERHGLVMDWQTHSYLHDTRGTQYVSGLAAGNYTTTGNGDTNSDAQIGVDGGVIADEDIYLTIVNSATPTNQFEQTISPLGYFPVMYRLGTGGIWYKDTATAYPMKMGTTYPTWNKDTAGTWTATEVIPNAYMCMWLIATNDVNYPIVALMGQVESTSLPNAIRDNNFYSLNLGTVPFLEFRPLYRLIYEVKTSFTNAVKSKLVDLLDIRLSPTVQIEQATATGTVTSVDVSGGTTGLVATGGPVTSTGVITLSGAVATTSAGLPTAGTAGQFLSKIDGTNYNTQWVDPSYTNTDATLYKATTNNQSATDPGPGRIKWNNVTQINSTEIYIDILNDNGTDISAYLARLTLSSIIWIQRQSNSTVYQRWALTSITNNTGWYTLGVTLLDENLGQFNNNENIVFAANIIGTGSVTTVSSSSTTNGLTLTTTNPNTTPAIALAGTLATTSGGTNLTTIGTANQVLGVNTGATGLEYKTITAGTAISVTPTAGSITIANTGVTSNVAGSGISVSGATGAVTITNTGVLSFSAGTTGLTPNTATTGAVTLAGTLIAVNGGTGLNTYAVGDILTANTTTTLSRVADVATGNALISGGIGVVPSWGKIGLATHISGTLGVANGGTGATATPTNGQLLIGNGTTFTVATLGSGTGISTTTGSGTLTINNTGVTSAVAGTGISVSAATGAVTFTNTGVTSITGTTNQITASAATGAVTLSTPTTFTAPGYVSVTTGLYESTTASVTAAGATQGTATALTTSYNVITTAAAGTGVILPTPLLNGWAISIVNRGANAVNVYPNTGGSINGGVANAPFVLTAGNAVILENSSTTAWFQTSNVASAGTGTVTSVGLALPSIFTVSGSPVISAGTLTGTLATQANNTVFAGPATGGPLAPTFRTLSLDELNDVTSAGATTGQYLLYNGTAWVPYGGAGAGGGLRTWGGNIASQTGTSVITPAVAPPTIAQGTQIATLTLTPLSTSSKFTVQMSLSVSASTNNNVHTCAIFRDSTYIGGAIQTFASGGNSNAISITLTDSPATASPVTYSARYGTSANTWYINRRVAENTYGGVQSGFEIQEY